ncbi:TPA: hypothetical protein DEO28_00415 [Candidatus Dependentiae bacterium]|nr:MAG: hypothetical protein UR14_C0001G0067 [candidate division TM6 bacterium GW2011_GWE2_31_21]KKP54053.1 MAG: hypothetical protein UR43_C0001G0071 [candidate division TM6 bacterium GW2011_GWF2_33_332]HBS48364.1 hypothetical protein [Candidatus Dependentiae bacterium]HBZ72962.1 hypothetical protein [Candidatus Dependentiae bacterium]
MNLKQFLDGCKSKNFFEEKNVVCFCGDTYPLIFINELLNFLHKKNYLAIKPQFIDLTAVNLNSILYQSFLGQSNIYFFGDFFENLGKKSKETLDVLSSYSGPHLIFTFVSNDKVIKDKIENKKFLFVELEEIDLNSFNELIGFFDKKYPALKNEHIKKIFDKLRKISLEEAITLLNYLDLINVNLFDEFSKNIHLYFSTDKSLFTLADLFFARDPKFFNLWDDIYEDYPDVFWIIYWSEQIWKASFAVMFLSQNRIQEARKISFRLPFAFINKYWKNYSQKELSNTYDFLYKADFALKTGSSFCALDLFISNHFLKKFI